MLHGQFGRFEHCLPIVKRKPEQRRKPWYARQALKLPEVQEAVSAEWARALPLPTSWDSELASAAIAKFSRMALAQHCPPGTPAPKQEWISSTSWDLMRLHAAERRRWFGAIRSRRQALCRVLFAAWRDAAAGEQVPQSATRVWVEWSLSISARLRSLKEAALTSRKAVESDFKAWLERKAEEVAKSAEAGDWRPMWALVRKLNGKRASKGPRAIPVWKAPNGKVAATEEEAADMLQAKFAEDFAHGTVLVAKEALRVELDISHVDSEGTALHGAPTSSEWACLLADALSTAKDGKACGPDEVPIEALKIGGPGLLRRLADVFGKIQRDGLPFQWRGGRMVAVPRKAGAPVSMSIVRGVLCADSAAKLLGRILRNKLRPTMNKYVQGWQAGAVQGGGTIGPSHSIKLFFAMEKAEKRSAAVLFGDLKAAYHRVLPEMVVGKVLTAEARCALFERAGMDAGRAQQLAAVIENQPSLLQERGVSEFWSALAAHWHKGNWFEVRGAMLLSRTLSGVRPGDAVADLIFVMLFVAVQKEIHKAVSDAGFGVQVKYCADAPFGHDLDEDEVCELLEPTYMDDLAIPMVADTPAGIMEAVQCAAEAMGGWRPAGMGSQ